MHQIVNTLCVEMFSTAHFDSRCLYSTFDSVTPNFPVFLSSLSSLPLPSFLSVLLSFSSLPLSPSASLPSISSDLYWEQHFTTIHVDTPFLEDSDQYLPHYQLPEQVEKLLETGKYENVENRVTKENYKRRMHNLLYLEEYERRKCMSR